MSNAKYDKKIRARQDGTVFLNYNHLQNFLPCFPKYLNIIQISEYYSDINYFIFLNSRIIDKHTFLKEYS